MAGGGSQPKPPDYVGQAREQGRQNIAAAQEQARLNRTDSVNAYGSSRWSESPTGQWTNTQSLSGPQQELLDTQQTNQLTGNRMAGDALRRYGGQAGAPIQTPGVRRDVQSTGVGPGSIDTSGLAAIPGAGDYGGQRQEVQDALYRNSTNTLDPQFQQREQAMRDRLVNSGVREGTEQWNQQWNEFGRDRTAAYGDARDRAIIGGGAEQSRMLNDSLGIRQQGFGEAATGAQFQSDAATQELNAELARLGFFNESGQQGFDQDLMARSLPMSELMSLINLQSGPAGQSGFGGGAGGGAQGIDPVDLTGAINQQYQAQVNQANQDQANRNTNVGAGASVISAALIAY